MTNSEPTTHDVLEQLHKIEKEMTTTLHKVELEVVAMRTEFEIVKRSVFTAIAAAGVSLIGAVMSLLLG